MNSKSNLGKQFSSIFFALVVILSVVAVPLGMSGTAEAATGDVVSTEEFGEEIYDIVKTGDTAYVLGTSGKLGVYDVSDPSNPTLLGSTTTVATSNQYGLDIDQEEGLVFIGGYDGTGSAIAIYDVSDPSSTSEIWSNTSDGFREITVDSSQNVFYTNDNNGPVNVYDYSTPSNPSKITESVDGINQVSFLSPDGNYIYGFDAGNDFTVFDVSDPSSISNIGTSALVGNKPSISPGVMDFKKDNSNYIYLLGDASLNVIDVSDPSNPSVIATNNAEGLSYEYINIDGDYAVIGDGSELEYWDISDPTSPTFVEKITPPTTNSLRNAHVIDSGYTYSVDNSTYDFTVLDSTDYKNTNPVSGTVETEDGTAVSDAYVEIWGVNYSNIDPANSTTASTLEERAQELIDEASNVQPGNYDPDYNLKEKADDNNGKYVAVHTRGDWSTGSMVPGHDSTDLSDPLIVHEDPSQPVVFSVWDASESNFGNEIDGDLPGATPGESQEITLTRLGPDGDEISTHSLETKEYVETGLVIGTKTHYAAETKLAEGFYRVSVADSDYSYVIAVGNPEEMIKTFEEDLKNKAGNLSDAASRLDQLKTDDKMGKITVEADSNGNFSADVPSSWETVAVTAYTDDGLLGDVQDPSTISLEDIRSEFENLEDSTASFKVTKEPVRTSPPDTNVTVTMVSKDSLGYGDIGEWLDNWEYLKQFLDEEALEELGAMTPQELTDQTEEEIENLRGELEQIKNENSQIEERYNELLEERTEREEQLSDAEIATMIDEAIASTESNLGVDQEEITIDIQEPDGWSQDENLTEPAEVDMVIPLEGSGYTPGTDVSDIVVTARHTDGSTHVLSEDQYSIDSGIVSGDAIKITGYELPSDVAAATFDVRVAGDSGVTETEQTVENPRSALGNIPEIDSVDFSTVSPKAGEQIAISVNSEDTEFRSVNGVRAYDQVGNEIVATQSNGDWVFTLQNSGTHVVEIDIENADGQVITEKTRLTANENGVNWPTNVRLTSGQTGNYAIAGDNVDNAEYKRSGNVLNVGVNLHEDDTGPVHIYASEVVDRPNTDIDVKLMNKSGRILSTPKTVNIYTAELSDDAIIYKDGNPLHKDTQYGEFTRSDGSTVIKTYAASGEADININNDPGFIERQSFRFDVLLDKYDIGDVL